MAALITINVENKDGVDYSPALVWKIDPQEHIKIIIPEDKAWLSDRAIIQYYDNQRVSLVDFITTETPAAVRALAATYMSTTVFINTIDDWKVEKVGYLQLEDFSVVQSNSSEPIQLVVNFGERNHARHKTLTYCAYPLIIIAVDADYNSVTVACCVEDTFPAGTAVAISAHANNEVVSSSCSTDGTSTEIVLYDPIVGDEEGATLSVT